MTVLLFRNLWLLRSCVFFILFSLVAVSPLFAQEDTSAKEKTSKKIDQENPDPLDNLSTDDFLNTKQNNNKGFFNKAEKNRVSWGSYLQMFLVLCFILFLIFVFFYLSKNKFRKNFLGVNGVEVLAKVSVMPRQTILLLRVGPRVLVVNAASDGNMRTLSEFSDQEEIDKLLSEINKNSRDNIFQSLLTRNQVLYDEEAENTDKTLEKIEKQTDKAEGR